MNIFSYTFKKHLLFPILSLVLLAFTTDLIAQDCCDQGDKPNSLTFIYTGESCSATNTTQQSDKYDCDDFNGGPNGLASVYIVASENDNGGGKQYFSGTVALNGTFVAASANANDDDFKSKTYFNIYSSQGGTLLQRVNYHTSCSAPVVPGEQVGGLYLMSATFKDGFQCGPATPPGPPEECPVPVITITSSQGTDNFNVCQDEAITFVTATPDCDQVVLSWNFGAGATPQTATGPGPHFVKYSNPGTATVTLTADNNCDGGTGSTVCPPPPPPPVGSDCCETIGGKPKTLTVRYTGADCSATNTSQQSGKYDCDNFNGGPNGASNVYITVTENDNGSGKQYFAGSVAINSSFSPSAGNVGDNEFKSKVFFNIYSSQGGTLLQRVNMHTSCSAPLVPGENIGSILLESAEWKDGSFCDVSGGGSSGGSGGADCCESNSGKPRKITLEYTGEGCSATNTSQQSDKYDCDNFNGGPNGASNVYITVTENENGGGKQYFAGNVALNGQFTPDAGNAGDNEFKSKFFINVYSSQGGTHLQRINMHTSCSAPLVSGDQIGSALLISVEFKDGSTCGPVTPPGPNCLDCEESVTIPITIIDCVCIDDGGDSDGDGICDEQDCAPQDPNLPTTPGTVCNDGDPNTDNDVIQADGCSCAGTPSVCDNVVLGGKIGFGNDCSPSTTVCTDPVPFINSCVNPTGGSGDFEVIWLKAINNPNCYPPTTTADNIDQDPFWSIVPGETGLTLNPGIVTQKTCYLRCTRREGCSTYIESNIISVDLEPGCGPGDPDCANITITAGNGIITIDNLGAAPYSSVKVFNSSWGTEYSCYGNCPGSTVSVSVGEGTYYVYAGYVAADYNLICEKSKTVNVVNGGNGGPCANAGGDSDGDGVCDDQDCEPNDSAYPAVEGTTCDDGDANTTNDVVQADGCTCAGTAAGGGNGDCGGITISASTGVISIGNLDGAPVSSVQIFSTDWTQTFFTCFGNCNAAENISVPAGSYIVKATYYNNSWLPQCDKTEIVVASSNLIGNDQFEFTAVKHLEHVELTWLHNRGDIVEDYILEHSLDGSNFDLVMDYPSEGTISREIYQGYDLSPANGDNFYRVKMQMANGSVEYSEVAKVYYEDMIDFELFPNPANDFVMTNLETVVGKKDVVITIYNNLGVKVQQFDLDEVYSKYYQMDIRNLKEGHYIIWLNVSGHKPVAKHLVVGKI